MTTTTVSVLIDIDRPAAILAGSGTWGPQTVSLDLAALTDAQRAELARAKSVAGRDAVLDLTQAADGYAPDAPRLPTLAQASPEGAVAVLEARIAQRAAAAAYAAQLQAKAQADLDAAQDRWMARSDEDILDANRHRAAVQEPENYRRLPLRPEVAERVARLSAIGAARKAEAERRVAEARRAEAERKAAREARRAQQITELVQRLPAEMQRRHAAGLLAEREILDAWRDILFAPLADFPRYARITEAEAQENLAEGEAVRGKIAFVAEDATEATPEEFATLEAIRAVAAQTLPPGTVATLREHRAEDDDAWLIRRRSVLVTVTDDALALSREYAA
jgi:hypothetical protein